MIPLPLINPWPEQAKRLQTQWNDQASAAYMARTRHSLAVFPAKKLTQAAYSQHSKGIFSRCKTIEIDAQGIQIRETYKGKIGTPVCRVRVAFNHAAYAPASVLIITDKPAEALPIEWEDEPEENETVNEKIGLFAPE